MLKQAPEQQICLGLDITSGFIIVAGSIVEQGSWKILATCMETPCVNGASSMFGEKGYYLVRII
jgi:hypothetical protein